MLLISKIFNFIKNNKFLLLGLLFIVIIKLSIIRELNNKDWEPDGFWHTIYAQTVFQEFPHQLKVGLEVWAKPLYTFVFGFLSLIFGDRNISFYQITNLIVWTISSIFVYLIAQSFTKKDSIALLIALSSGTGFITFRSSMTALTEPIFTLVLILSIYFIIKEKYVISTLLTSLLPLGRIEGFMFIGIYFCFLIYKCIKKELKVKEILIYAFILILPAFLWNFAGFLMTKSPLFIISNGYPTTAGQYGYGSWLSYVKGFVLQDPISLILYIIGTIGIANNIIKKKTNTTIFLCWFYATGLLVLNTIFWKYGLFGTTGLMRYFVPIIPLMILVSVTILPELKIKLLNSSLLILILVLLQALYSLVFMYAYKGSFMGLLNYPYVPDEYRESGAWIKSQVLTCKVLAVQPAILYYAERTQKDGALLFDTPFTIGSNSEDLIFVVTSDWVKNFGFKGSNTNRLFVLLKKFGDTLIYFVDSPTDNSNCGLYQSK